MPEEYMDWNSSYLRHVQTLELHQAGDSEFGMRRSVRVVNPHRRWQHLTGTESLGAAVVLKRMSS